MKVGDYVRTKNGNIGRIIEYHTEPTDYYFNCYETDLSDNFMEKYLTEYQDIKSSPNIIDLIEAGDYVNGFKVVWKDINKKIFSIHNYYASENIINDSKKIKSILTREQFESMEYRIGE